MFEETMNEINESMAALEKMFENKQVLQILEKVPRLLEL